MNDYPCFYCGGHPGLGTPEPTEATVTVGRAELAIQVSSREASVPLDSVWAIEERATNGKEEFRQEVMIAVNRAHDHCKTDDEITLLFDNVGFAKAFVLRLKLAMGSLC
ncbi:MAG: hypothetical protein GY842_24950 [bacterium]|nr:hypothetical protein [bacterium]